jgi:hypothetical protein
MMPIDVDCFNKQSQLVAVPGSRVMDMLLGH